MLELLRKLRGDAAALPPRASGRQIALAWLGGALAIACVASTADWLSLSLLLRRRFAYPAEFWGHLERLVYYLMFPALLFRAVSRTGCRDE